jgi:hypothetical protein
MSGSDRAGTFYYEVHNRDNVDLVDIVATLIDWITPTGIRTGAANHAIDIMHRRAPQRQRLPTARGATMSPRD